jgi:predicted DNA-binding transcriptional regulator YafY
MAATTPHTKPARSKAAKGRTAIDRNAQVVRVLQILRELDRLGGVDLYELAQRYGTTTRTIRRDFAALEGAGVPLVEDSSDGRKKRWRVDYRGQQHKLAELLDASHYLALRVAMDQAGATRRTSAMYATLEDLSDKIETSLGAKGRKLIESINGCFYSYEKFAYQSSPPDVFWPLIGAIAERQLCVVKYRAPRAEPYDAKFRALPLKLFAHGGAIYLHAFVPKHGNVIVLNLQRLVALEVLEQRGTPPPDYNPEQWEASAFGIFVGKTPVRYKLRFESEAAPYIRERVWHPTQKLRELAGGVLELTFTCSESYEVAAWVASWRTAVEVLEPESLRTELTEFGKWIGTKYPAGKRG